MALFSSATMGDVNHKIRDARDKFTTELNTLADQIIAQLPVIVEDIKSKESQLDSYHTTYLQNKAGYVHDDNYQNARFYYSALVGVSSIFSLRYTWCDSSQTTMENNSVAFFDTFIDLITFDLRTNAAACKSQSDRYHTHKNSFNPNDKLQDYNNRLNAFNDWDDVNRVATIDGLYPRAKALYNFLLESLDFLSLLTHEVKPFIGTMDLTIDAALDRIMQYDPASRSEFILNFITIYYDLLKEWMFMTSSKIYNESNNMYVDLPLILNTCRDNEPQKVDFIFRQAPLWEIMILRDFDPRDPDYRFSELTLDESTQFLTKFFVYDYDPRIPIQTISISGSDNAEPEDTAAVFNEWYRFSHDTSGNFPANPSETTSWSYDDSTGIFSSTVNSGTYIGIVSDIQYFRYELECTLSSSSSDDDMIGIIIAFVKDEDNNEHVLSVVRSCGGDGSSWALTYNSYQSSQVILNDGQTLAPPPSGGWSSGGPTKIKVVRDNNLISVTCSQFGSLSLDSNTTISIDLDSDELLEKFKPACSYGYGCHSQQSASFSGISFKATKVSSTYNNDKQPLNVASNSLYTLHILEAATQYYETSYYFSADESSPNGQLSEVLSNISDDKIIILTTFGQEERSLDLLSILHTKYNSNLQDMDLTDKCYMLVGRGYEPPMQEVASSETISFNAVFPGGDLFLESNSPLYKAYLSEHDRSTLHINDHNNRRNTLKKLHSDLIAVLNQQNKEAFEQIDETRDNLEYVLEPDFREVAIVVSTLDTEDQSTINKVILTLANKLSGQGLTLYYPFNKPITLLVSIVGYLKYNITCYLYDLNIDDLIDLR